MSEFSQYLSDGVEGRRVLVTGGSMGIGLAVSRELARRGARVIVAARDLDAVRAAIAELDGEGHEVLGLDVSEDRAWDEAIQAVDTGGELSGLVCAAGVLGPIGKLDEISTQDFRQAVEINLLGTVLALHHMLPRLRRAGGRAVLFSGGGATSPLSRYDAYAVSKAAVVRLAENVSVSAEIEINCVAPGFVATRMHHGTLAAGPEAAGSDYYARTREQLAEGGFPATEAAELTCFLLSDAAAGISGRLLSAQWDPWREESYRERLRADAELATLRRIDGVLFRRVPGEPSVD
jgi:3-oxoacyl-[acyl-carrier protein] reductase